MNTDMWGDLMAETNTSFELVVQGIYESILEPGDVAVDVGAHVGSHTIPMARKVFPNGKILAFEPLPMIRELLTGHIYANHRELVEIIDLHPFALSNFEGDADFIVAKDALAYSGLKKRNYDIPTELKKISVTVKMADSLLLDLPGLAYMKVDAEGAELSVVQGAVKTLEKFRPIVSFEFGECSIGEYGITVDDMGKFWIDNHYHLFDVKGQHLSREDFARSASLQHVWDYVAIPEENVVMEERIVSIIRGLL
jgi:FkbM family methyltransferase